eukprot:TRINITY_DN1659_c0_g1_i1.p1 TRINITY_DN1659_c0_g1~~TRINITY_DN1659_c0_g1_i1.p1  ORF type:complete len:491 (+),score=136.73 TRINITY_DN1659_c0_g1_i1:51-1523(+)
MAGDVRRDEAAVPQPCRSTFAAGIPVPEDGGSFAARPQPSRRTLATGVPLPEVCGEPVRPLPSRRTLAAGVPIPDGEMGVRRLVSARTAAAAASMPATPPSAALEATMRRLSASSAASEKEGYRTGLQFDHLGLQANAEARRTVTAVAGDERVEVSDEVEWECEPFCTAPRVPGRGLLAVTASHVLVLSRAAPSNAEAGLRVADLTGAVWHDNGTTVTLTAAGPPRVALRLTFSAPSRRYHLLSCITSNRASRGLSPLPPTPPDHRCSARSPPLRPAAPPSLHLEPTMSPVPAGASEEQLRVLVEERRERAEAARRRCAALAKAAAEAEARCASLSAEADRWKAECIQITAEAAQDARLQLAALPAAEHDHRAVVIADQSQARVHCVAVLERAAARLQVSRQDRTLAELSLRLSATAALSPTATCHRRPPRCPAPVNPDGSPSPRPPARRPGPLSPARQTVAPARPGRRSATKVGVALLLPRHVGCSAAV